MNFYIEGKIVNIVIPFKDHNGNGVIPTAMSAVLYDGENVVIETFATIAFDVSQTSTTLVIPGVLNMLSDDEEEVRRLVVKVTHTDGEFSVSKAYAIEPEQSLRVMVNSFMTKETANMMASRSVSLTTLVNETDTRKVFALVEAYNRITLHSMNVKWTDDLGKVTGEALITSDTWVHLTQENFMEFPVHFRKALRSAQLAEADELLQGNVIARKHAQGIVSETIGESSVTLREGFVGIGSSSLSAAAMSILSGYLTSSISLGRA